jgi:hypothetical protein
VVLLAVGNTPHSRWAGLPVVLLRRLRRPAGWIGPLVLSLLSTALPAFAALLLAAWGRVRARSRARQARRCGDHAPSVCSRRWSDSFLRVSNVKFVCMCFCMPKNAVYAPLHFTAI